MSKVGRERGCCFWLLGPRVTRPAAAASRWASSRSAPTRPTPIHLLATMDKTLISLINKVSRDSIILFVQHSELTSPSGLFLACPCLPLSRSRPFARSPVARSTLIRPPATRRILVDRRPEPHRACLASSLRKTPKADACQGLGVYGVSVCYWLGSLGIVHRSQRRVGSAPDRSHRVPIEVCSRSSFCLLASWCFEG